MPSLTSLGLLVLCVCFLNSILMGVLWAIWALLCPSGIGGIIRDHSFSSILSLSGPSSFYFVDEAKMIALRTGLRQIASLSLSNIIAEGDSFVLSDGCRALLSCLGDWRMSWRKL